MRQHTEIALRNAMGNFQGKFSDEWTTYFNDLEKRYASGQNGQHSLSEMTIPLWIERAKDKGIDHEWVAPPEKGEPAERRGPGRPPTKKPELIGA